MALISLKCVRLGFLDSFLDENIINTVNSYNSILGYNVQYFRNRHYIWLHLRLEICM